jgi:hypothetical protein
MYAIGDYDFRLMTEHFIRFVIRWEAVRKVIIEETVVL